MREDRGKAPLHVYVERIYARLCPGGDVARKVNCVLSMPANTDARTLMSLFLLLRVSGRCVDGNPCVQLCFDIHNMMYECDCLDGYVLQPNGYSCSCKYTYYDEIFFWSAVVHRSIDRSSECVAGVVRERRSVERWRRCADATL